MQQLPITGVRALVFSALMLCGCASHGPDLPDYAAPNLEEAQAAVVKGSDGTYIMTVDNTTVPGTGIRMDNFGGNKVLLTPGQHRITVERRTSTSMIMHSNSVAYECVFEAGHVYKACAASFFSTLPKLTDVTADKEISAK